MPRPAGPLSPPGISLSALRAKPPRDRDEELLHDEELLIRRLGEAGYRSPFYTGSSICGAWPLGEDFYAWARARSEFVARPCEYTRQVMESFVTESNPPLASDVEKAVAGQRGRKCSFRRHLIITIAWGLAVLSVVMTAMAWPR